MLVAVVDAAAAVVATPQPQEQGARVRVVRKRHRQRAAPVDCPRARGAGGVPTGRGGGQDREWYRGIPIPPGAANNFSRRNNTNYMETGVLSALQLTSMFPNLVVENFYIKTRNSIEAGVSHPPHAYVIPVQRDMTKPAELVRILKAQGIEVGYGQCPVQDR